MSEKGPITAPLIDFSIEDLWPILQKQRNVILLFLGTVLLTTLVGGLLRTREYRAGAVIHLSPRTGQEVAVSEVVDFNTRGFFEIQQFYRTQIQIILSRSVREEVVRRYEAAGYDDLTLVDGGANTLLAMLTVVPEEQSQLVEIAVTHTDPERAATLANLVAEVYKDKNLDSRREASEGATDWLQGQIDEYAARVKTAQEALDAYKGETKLVDADSSMNTLQARLNALNGVYGDRTTALVEQQTTLKSHEALARAGAWRELAKVMEGPLLDTLERDLAAALATEADLAARYGPKHPDREQVAARLASLEASLRREVERILDADRAAVRVLEADVASLDAELASVKEAMLGYQQGVTTYGQLKDELDRSKGFYEKLSSRLEEVRLASRTQLNNVQLVDAALPPTSPWKPNIPMSLAVATIVGVVGGVGLGLLREYLDDTISSPVDVTAHLKAPFLGLVPRLPDGISGSEADLFTHHHPQSSVAEAVRGLRAMIEMNPSGPPPRRILVTSSVAREGKTSTTLRLAVSFAQMGKRVVLIDADLRRPRVHKVFGADSSVGLSSYLVGVAKADEIAHATPVPNLHVIYAGAPTDRPAELMGSPRMAQLLEELEGRFDVILIDTPPSVALSDAVTLSRHVDGVVLVVKEQSVSRMVVKQTLDLMRQVDANLLGVVLNNVDLQRAGSKYRYYYAYRDYYASYQPGAEAEKAAK